MFVVPGKRDENRWKFMGRSGGHVIQFFSCCDFLGRRCWFFSPRNGNKRTTLTVCYPHLFGGLQFSFAWFFFTPVFIFFIYIVFGSLLPFFFLVVPPSEHLLKLPDWQQRHFLNGSPGSCRMISGVHEGSARTSSRFHCLPAFLWVYPGN